MGVDRSKGWFSGLIGETFKQQNLKTMKNLILIFAAVMSFNVAFASNGEGEVKVIDAERVSVSLDNEGQKDFIISSNYNVDAEKVEFLFKNNVSMIQVYDANGNVEMVLPIGTTDVSLGLSLFEPGTYRMGFMVDGMNDIQFTNVTIK